MEAKKHPSSRRYPPEMKERAVRMVEQTIAESGERWGVVSRIARQLGIGEQTLRNWVERAEIDTGRRPGTTTDEKARSPSWKRKSASFGGPMRSSSRPRLFSRRSSTAPSRSGLHRRPS